MPWSPRAVQRPVARVLVDRSRLGEAAQHFRHEERVPVGLPVQIVCQVDAGIVKDVASGRLHEGDDSGVVEALEIDARDAGRLSAKRHQSF